MKEWLLSHYASSTFNKCPHQPLPGMTGPAIRLRVDPKATPKAVHTPETVPLHWQDEVEDQINIALGVLERVVNLHPGVTAWSSSGKLMAHLEEL